MPVTINGDGSITGLSVGGLPDGSVDADTLASNAVTSAKLAANSVNHTHTTGLQRRISTVLTLPTNAGQVTHNLTAGVKKIELLLANVSGTSYTNLYVQIGDSSGLATSGYGHGCGYHRSSSPYVTNTTGAFATTGLSSNTYEIFGKWEFNNSYENYWVSAFSLWGSLAADHEFWGVGYKNLSSAITQIKFYLSAGNFDSGYLTIMETLGDD